MDNTGKLLYKSLSLVYLQIFTVENFCCEELQEEKFKLEPNSIDHQIFENSPEDLVRRYKLQSFDFRLDLKEEENNGTENAPAMIEGKMYVEMSVFFNRTVALSYRMMIDGQTCRANKILDTDELISLTSLHLGAEHWKCRQTEGEKGNIRDTASTINLDTAQITVDKFHLDENGRLITGAEKTNSLKSFEDIQRRYKRFVINNQDRRPKISNRIRDYNYVYIDIWEDIWHSNNLFDNFRQDDKLKAEDIIAHISQHHKKELIGLMSFYPYEWPYRTEDSFAEVCGSNIAIDTDDLILVNENMCVVFGTYGLRGKNQGDPTNWTDHLAHTRLEYHVSWPEYMLILEMILAKKYTLGFVSDVYLEKSIELTSLGNTRSLIEENSREGVKTTKILMKLDAIKYSRYISHKIMFERTTRRLEVEREMARVNETIAQIDKFLFNISEIRKLRQSVILNIVLGIISAASLFGILFQSIEIPFMRAVGFGEYAGNAGMTIIIFTIFIIILSAAGLIVMSFRNNRLKR